MGNRFIKSGNRESLLLLNTSGNSSYGYLLMAALIGVGGIGAFKTMGTNAELAIVGAADGTPAAMAVDGTSNAGTSVMVCDEGNVLCQQFVAEHCADGECELVTADLGHGHPLDIVDFEGNVQDAIDWAGTNNVPINGRPWEFSDSDIIGAAPVVDDSSNAGSTDTSESTDTSGSTDNDSSGCQSGFDTSAGYPVCRDSAPTTDSGPTTNTPSANDGCEGGWDTSGGYPVCRGTADSAGTADTSGTTEAGINDTCESGWDTSAGYPVCRDSAVDESGTTHPGNSHLDDLEQMGEDVSQSAIDTSNIGCDYGVDLSAGYPQCVYELPGQDAFEFPEVADSTEAERDAYRSVVAALSERDRTQYLHELEDINKDFNDPELIRLVGECAGDFNNSPQSCFASAIETMEKSAEELETQEREHYLSAIEGFGDKVHNDHYVECRQEGGTLMACVEQNLDGYVKTELDKHEHINIEQCTRYGNTLNSCVEMAVAWADENRGCGFMGRHCWHQIDDKVVGLGTSAFNGGRNWFTDRAEDVGEFWDDNRWFRTTVGVAGWIGTTALTTAIAGPFVGLAVGIAIPISYFRGTSDGRKDWERITDRFTNPADEKRAQEIRALMEEAGVTDFPHLGDYDDDKKFGNKLDKWSETLSRDERIAVMEFLNEQLAMETEQIAAPTDDQIDDYASAVRAFTSTQPDRAKRLADWLIEEGVEGGLNNPELIARAAEGLGDFNNSPIDVIDEAAHEMVADIKDAEAREGQLRLMEMMAIEIEYMSKDEAMDLFSLDEDEVSVGEEVVGLFTVVGGSREGEQLPAEVRQRDKELRGEVEPEAAEVEAAEVEAAEVEAAEVEAAEVEAAEVEAAEVEAADTDLDSSDRKFENMAADQAPEVDYSASAGPGPR